MDPVSIAAVSWGVTSTGWFVSPYITRLLDKAYAQIFPGKSMEIRSQMDHTVTRLKLILEAAEGSEHKDLFERLLKDLKSAWYDMEAMLDEVEYIRRHESGENRNIWQVRSISPIRIASTWFLSFPSSYDTFTIFSR